MPQLTDDQIVLMLCGIAFAASVLLMRFVRRSATEWTISRPTNSPSADRSQFVLNKSNPKSDLNETALSQIGTNQRGAE